MTGAALDPIRVLERAERVVGRRGSAGPGAGQATPLPELGAALELAHAPWGGEVARALAGVAVAIHESFPHNMFADLDALAASLCDLARGADGSRAVRAQGRALVALHRQFGADSPIRFRYVHDFLYGFDWARWVAREPHTRQAHGPFSPRFVRRMVRRGQELLALIGVDDRTYPRLEGGGYRNPFSFRRDPADEGRLFACLAAADHLPVQAWRIDAVPTWRRDYYALRAQTAATLGLAV